MTLSLNRLAIKNILRKPFRSIAITSAAALAVGLVFFAYTILNSVEQSLELGMARLGADIMVIPEGQETKSKRILLSGEPAVFYMDQANLARIAGIRGVNKASPQLFMLSATLQCCTLPTVFLVGYDPGTDFTITPWIANTFEVRDKDVDKTILGAETYYAAGERSVTFFGKNFAVEGELAPTGMDFFDFSVFMDMRTARDMIKISHTQSLQPLQVRDDQISSVMVKIDNGYDVREIVKDIEKTVPGVRALSTRSLIGAVRADVKRSLWGVTVAGVAVWFMSLALTGLVFAMIINERRREFGVLRAMGAPKIQVFRLVLTEAALLSGLGGLLGTSAGLMLIVYFKTLITSSMGNTPFLLPSPLILLSSSSVSILLVVLTGSISAAYPAFRASRLDPDAAIRQVK